MMSLIKPILIGMLATLAFSHPTLAKNGDRRPAETNPEIRTTMRDLARSLSELWSYLATPNKFEAAQNTRVIKRHTETLAQAIQQLHSKQAPLAAQTYDPTLTWASKQMQTDINAALDELKTNQQQQARAHISEVVNSCMNCHTTSDRGSHDIGIVFKAEPTRVNLFDRAYYYTAVREYDKSLNDFEQALTGTDLFKTDPNRWEMGLKRSLAIAVRVKKNPSLGLEVISRLFEDRAVPLKLKSRAQIWRQSLKKWRLESEEARRAHRPIETNLKTAQAFLEEGKKLDRTHRSPNSGFISYLRASALLNDLLNKRPSVQETGEILYYSGIVAEALTDLSLEAVEQSYYESCIRVQPHTPLAGRCFQRLQAALKPQEGMMRTPTSATLPLLNELEALAKVRSQVSTTP